MLKLFNSVGPQHSAAESKEGTMRAGLALLLLLSTMLGGNCQDTDSQQGEHAMPTLTY